MLPYNVMPKSPFECITDISFSSQFFQKSPLNTIIMQLKSPLMVSEHVHVWDTRPPTCHSSPCHDACGEFALLKEEAAPAPVCSTPPETLRQHRTSATASQFPPQLSLTDTLILKSAHMRGVLMFLRSCSGHSGWIQWESGSCTDFHKWGLFESGSFLYQSTVDALQTSCAST